MPDPADLRLALAIGRGMAVRLTMFRRAAATSLTMGIRTAIVDQGALAVRPPALVVQPPALVVRPPALAVQPPALVVVVQPPALAVQPPALVVQPAPVVSNWAASRFRAA